MPATQLLIVHSLKLVREALQSLLDHEADFDVNALAGNATDAVRMAVENTSDVVIMEANMLGPSAIEATRQIRKVRPEANVLFVSSYEDEDLLFECMQAGASGFLSKDSGRDELVGAIREVARGGKYLAAPALARFVDGWRIRKRSAGKEPNTLLTAREREILKLLAEGSSVKECAEQLKVSAKTIEAHKFNLMRKLDIHNKAQLVHYAYQKKIVRLPAMAS